MLIDYLEPFCRIRKASRPNDLGGYVEHWEECETFQGGVTFVPGGEVDVAGLRALRTVPMLVHEGDVSLWQDEYVRRISDGAIYRVTGNSDDMHTPACATMQFAQVPVEKVVAAT